MKYFIGINQLVWQRKVPEAKIQHAIIFNIIHGICVAQNNKLERDMQGYTWISFKLLLNQIPMLNITRQGVAKIVKRLAGFGLIKIKNNGQKKMYKLTEHSDILITNSDLSKEQTLDDDIDDENEPVTFEQPDFKTGNFSITGQNKPATFRQPNFQTGNFQTTPHPKPVTNSQPPSQQPVTFRQPSLQTGNFSITSEDKPVTFKQPQGAEPVTNRQPNPATSNSDNMNPQLQLHEPVTNHQHKYNKYKYNKDKKKIDSLSKESLDSFYHNHDRDYSGRNKYGAEKLPVTDHHLQPCPESLIHQRDTTPPSSWQENGGCSRSTFPAPSTTLSKWASSKHDWAPIGEEAAGDEFNFEENGLSYEKYSNGEVRIYALMKDAYTLERCFTKTADPDIVQLKASRFHGMLFEKKDIGAGKNKIMTTRRNNMLYGVLYFQFHSTAPPDSVSPAPQQDETQPGPNMLDWKKQLHIEHFEKVDEVQRLILEGYSISGDLDQLLFFIRDENGKEFEKKDILNDPPLPIFGAPALRPISRSRPKNVTVANMAQIDENIVFWTTGARTEKDGSIRMLIQRERRL